MSNQVTIKPLENSEVEIEGEIAVEKFNEHRDAAIKALNAGAKIDGFRAGHIPEKVLIDHVGEERVLLEMAELALAAAYPTIVRENKIDALGRPEITLTKLAKDNPLGFKIKTAVNPDFSLPDYKKIASELNAAKPEPITVEEKEVTDVIAEIQKARTNKETGATPELNDEFAKTLGDFKSVDELKTKIKENLTHEKEHRNLEKKRIGLMDKLADGTEIKLPGILIEWELDKMIAELKGQIEGMQLKFDEYLTHLKKTEAELKKEWRDAAVKRVKIGLILAKIADAEKIKPNEEEVKKEVAHLQQHYPEADPLRLAVYVTDHLTNDKVLEFLGNLK